EEPGRELLRVSIGRGEAVGAEKDLLADRFNVFDAAEHAIKIRQDRRVVALVDERERLAVALLGAAHEVFVAGSSKGNRRQVAGLLRLSSRRLFWGRRRCCPGPASLICVSLHAFHVTRRWFGVN